MRFKHVLKWLLVPVLLAAVLSIPSCTSQPDNRVHVFFLDVGQGDAILIRQGSTQILIDGGPSPQAITLELGKCMPYQDRKIELVILTHPHYDHLKGLVEVLNRYTVGRVLYPPAQATSDEEYDSDLYNEWLRLIQDKGINSTLAQAYQQIDLGDIIIDVLNPPQVLFSGTESDIDNNSVVLQIRASRISFLLTSDLMWEGESELIAKRLVPPSTVLKVAHHGSNTSSIVEFLNVADPQLAVISVGAGNRFGHPTPAVVARLTERLGAENIYRTDEDATIEFITDGERLWVN